MLLARPLPLPPPPPPHSPAKPARASLRPCHLVRGTAVAMVSANAAAAASWRGQKHKRVASVANPLVKHCVKLRLSLAYRRIVVVGLAPILTHIRGHSGFFSEKNGKGSKIAPKTWQSIRLVCSPSLVQTPASHLRNGRVARDLKMFASEVQQVPGPTTATLSTVPTHKVTVHDRQRGVIHEFIVPEDQYILHTAESQDISLPFACRHGCCTSCAVRIKSGQIRQPEALGISAELKEKGYALLCVGFPTSDVEVETQDEDEVYWLQFGRYFARGPVERDDYALELAMGDE